MLQDNDPKYTNTTKDFLRRKKVEGFRPARSITRLEPPPLHSKKQQYKSRKVSLKKNPTV